MNKIKLGLLIIVIFTVAWIMTSSKEFKLDTSEIVIATNGCGNLSTDMLQSQLEEQGIALFMEIEEIEVGECKVFKFTTKDLESYSISDYGLVQYEKK